MDPTENISGNIVRRALKIIRDDYASIHANTEPQSLIVSNHISDYKTKHENLSEFVLDSLDELEREIESSVDNIRTLSEQHINQDEVILTVGQYLLRLYFPSLFLLFSSCLSF